MVEDNADIKGQSSIILKLITIASYLKKFFLAGQLIKITKWIFCRSPAKVQKFILPVRSPVSLCWTLALGLGYS